METDSPAPAGTPDPDGARREALTLAADLAAVAAFVAIGRRSHAEGVTLAGIAATGWPYWLGAAAGWSALRFAGRSARPVGAGVVVLGVACGVGHTLRAVVTDAPTPPSFVAAGSFFLGVFVLGWRGVALLAGRRRAARA